MNRASRWTGATLAAALAGNFAQAQTTVFVSVDSAGVLGNADSYSSSLSADGRFAVLDSLASNLVPGDTNLAYDVFVHDRQTGTTERVSVDSAGVQGDAHSYYSSISADGRFVSFHSIATNLVAGDTNGVDDVFVHDRQTGTTTRVSVDSFGAEGDSASNHPSISADGRFVAFNSLATNLVAGDANGVEDVFVHDRQSGITERVSLNSSGTEGNQDSNYPSISADGRFVAFASLASSLITGDTNALEDVFVRDRQTGTTERVSVSTAGAQGNDYCFGASISDDGRFVAFDGLANNLVAGDTSAFYDVFVRDRQAGTTERVSVDSAGTQANQDSLGPRISANGRFVAFDSVAWNLVPGDGNGYWDVFVHDRQTGTTERASVSTAGVQGNRSSSNAAISADGRFVEFFGGAWTLVPGDTNFAFDVFLRDRQATAVHLCQPGTGVVIACPCSNPPANAPRGCDNSSATGGAQLNISGVPSLAFDTLALVTNGEKPSATSVVLQGNAEITNGVVFGQGVRCVGGVLKRLYVKTAGNGSITVPIGSDLSVSARSWALGDPISAGTNRWYAVYYRDTIVLGGCPATSTFNVTQTQLVTWGA